MPTTINPDVVATSAATELLDRHTRAGIHRAISAVRDGGKVDVETIARKVSDAERADLLSFIAWLNGCG